MVGERAVTQVKPLKGGYITAHSPTLQWLYLHHSSFSNSYPTSQLVKQSSFSNLSVTSPTSQFILQPFSRFTYVTAHSPTLHLHHSSFSNPSVALPTSQLILQPFRCFTYVADRKSELILQHFRHFTYITAHSPTLQWLYPRHSSFSNPSVASPTSQFIL